MEHVVCDVTELPPGNRKIVNVGRLSIGVFNLRGEYFALYNRCAHRGAPICEGVVGEEMLPSEPGKYVFSAETHTISCPWHRWEYDLRTGQSYPRPDRYRTRTYPVKVSDGKVVVEIR